MGCGTEELIFLKNSAAELQKLGRDWGLTEEEITKCVEEALAQSNQKQKAKYEKSSKNFVRKLWRYCLVAVKVPIYISLIVVLLFLGMLTLTSVSDSADRVVSQALQPYGYDMMRAVRLVFLPVRRFVNLTQYYNAECIIDNPFYQEPELDCRVCKHFKRVKEIHATNFSADKFTAYVNTYKPALIKGSLTRNITYSDMRELYLDNPDSFDDTLSSFESTHTEMNNVDALFNPDRKELLNTSTTIQIHWQTKSVKASSSLRTLFPRPRYLPEKAEIMLEKHMLFDGRETPTYELPYVSTPTQLYILASGKRRVLVRPAASCKKSCDSMLVFLEAGDALMYHREMYRLFIAANQHGPSLGYLVPFVV